MFYFFSFIVVFFNLVTCANDDDRQRVEEGRQREVSTASCTERAQLAALRAAHN